SHSGADFQAICKAYANRGFRYGAMIIDAAKFLPQSRPRVFMSGIDEELFLDPGLVSPEAQPHLSSNGLQNAYERLDERAKRNWVWWNLPSPAMRNLSFADIIEENPTSVVWNTAEQTSQLLS